MKQEKLQTVLITGGAGGIGFCTAMEFARNGYRVLLSDLNAERLEEAAQKLRAVTPEVHTYVVDVTKQRQVEELAKSVLEAFGSLEVLINNAGVGHHGELAETSLKTWKLLVDVNFWGPLYHIYSFLPAMKAAKRGSILNVSSGQAFFKLPSWGAYASIKAALGILSEIMTVEFRKYGIRVTTVYPWMVNTGFYDAVQSDTWVGRMSMKLVPYYSLTPETVGRQIYRAARRGPKVEWTSVINRFGQVSQVIPGLSDLIAYASNTLLTKGAA